MTTWPARPLESSNRVGVPFTHRAMVEILSHHGGPTGIRKAGRRKLVSIATKHAPRTGKKHNTTLTCPARRRHDAPFAILRNCRRGELTDRAWAARAVVDAGLGA